MASPSKFRNANVSHQPDLALRKSQFTRGHIRSRQQGMQHVSSTNCFLRLSMCELHTSMAHL
jgi:hypothetical protein